MTDRLTAIAERLKAATPGPWEVSRTTIPGESGYKVDVQREGDPLAWICETGYNTHHATQTDAEFIAHSRSDVEYLLARVQELTAANASLTADAERLESLVRQFAGRNWKSWAEGVEEMERISGCPKNVALYEHVQSLCARQRRESR